MIAQGDRMTWRRGTGAAGAAMAACRAAGAAVSDVCRRIRAYNQLAHLNGRQLRAIAETPGALERVLAGRLSATGENETGGADGPAR